MLKKGKDRCIGEERGGGKGTIKAQLYGDKPTRHKTVICLHYQCLCCLDDLSDSEVN